MPLTFRLTGHPHNDALDVYLEQKGFLRMDESMVMTLDLAGLPSTTASIYQELEAEAWFSRMMVLDSASQIRKLKHIELLKMSALPAIYGSVEAGGAIGLGVLDGEYAGIFDIMTDPAMRRRGHARALTLGILEQAKRNGATTAYLQVVANNMPAVALYESLGFVASYRYWYRCRPDQSNLQRQVL